MTTRASVEQLLSICLRLYSELNQRFRDNYLVQQTWAALSLDTQQQIQAVRGLNSAYWNDFRVEAEKDGEPGEPLGREFNLPGSFEGMSFHDCISLSLDLEEPLILNVYSRVIRRLRDRETNSSLDFYIMVKAHVARMLRIVQSFSGDPILTRRALALLEGFESKVQTPARPEPRTKTIQQVSSKKSDQVRKNKSATTTRIAVKGTRPKTRNEHSRAASERIKPLVKKIKVPRRQAQR